MLRNILDSVNSKQISVLCEMKELICKTSSTLDRLEFLMLFKQNREHDFELDFKMMELLNFIHGYSRIQTLVDNYMTDYSSMLNFLIKMQRECDIAAYVAMYSRTERERDLFVFIRNTRHILNEFYAYYADNFVPYYGDNTISLYKIEKAKRLINIKFPKKIIRYIRSINEVRDTVVVRQREEKSYVPIFLDDSDIELGEFTFEHKNVDSDDKSICSICMEEDRQLVEISCGHRFHFSEIENWLKKKQTCPNCRAEIEVELM